MEAAWPALINTLVDAPPERRTRLLVKTLVGINGSYLGALALYALGRWLLLADPMSVGAVVFVAAYALVPSLLFIPAYVLWRVMSRRPRQATRVPLQLD
jgi:membrane protein YdbS with pleckstrin-like domain